MSQPCRVPRTAKATSNLLERLGCENSSIHSAQIRVALARPSSPGETDREGIRCSFLPMPTCVVDASSCGWTGSCVGCQVPDGMGFRGSFAVLLGAGSRRHVLRASATMRPRRANIEPESSDFWRSCECRSDRESSHIRSRWTLAPWSSGHHREPQPVHIPSTPQRRARSFTFSRSSSGVAQRNSFHAPPHEGQRYRHASIMRRVSGASPRRKANTPSDR